MINLLNKIEPFQAAYAAVNCGRGFDFLLHLF